MADIISNPWGSLICGTGHLEVKRLANFHDRLVLFWDNIYRLTKTKILFSLTKSRE